MNRQNQAVARRFHQTDPAEKWQLVQEFNDAYERELATRIIWENWPEHLPKSEVSRLNDFTWACWHDESLPGPTIHQRRLEIDELLSEEKTQDSIFILKDYLSYLANIEKRGLKS